MQLRPWRITAWWAKAIFLLIWILVGVPIELALLAIGAEAAVALLPALLVSLLMVGLGARVFRVQDEDLLEPRPWWQFTGRARLSFVVGWLSVAVLVVYLITAPVSEFTLGEDVISFVFWAVISVAYLNSGIRLRQRETATKRSS